MKIKVKPKAFGPVYIHVAADGALRYGMDTEHVDSVNPPATSPADLLLFSLGSCIAISIKMAAAKHQATLAAFHIEARASKAEDLPSRFGRFELKVDKGFVADASLAQELLGQAKSICTVSNTLNADVDVLSG